MARIETEEELRRIYINPKERAFKKQLDRLDKHCRRFIELSPFLVLSSYGKNGLCDASPRGEGPGFAHILDEKTLLLPDRPGNNRLDSLSNILINPSVGLIFLIPGVEEVLRVNGRAEIRNDPELLERFRVRAKLPATVLRIEVEEAYLHCAKAIMRSALWKPEAQIDRSLLPTMGEMLRDHRGDLGEPMESQEEMRERYLRALY